MFLTFCCVSFSFCSSQDEPKNWQRWASPKRWRWTFGNKRCGILVLDVLLSLWLIELNFTSHRTQNRSFLFYHIASTDEINTTHAATIQQKHKDTITQNKHKNLEPGLVVILFRGKRKTLNNRCWTLFMKLFKTSNINRQHCFSFDMLSDLWDELVKTLRANLMDFVNIYHS